MDFEVNDFVLVEKPMEWDREYERSAIRPCLHDFLGSIVEIWDDGTADIEDGDGEVFDRIPLEWLSLE